MHDNNILSDQLFNILLTTYPVVLIFIVFLKIHKSIPHGDGLPPFWGIISSINGPTSRAEYFLDHILNPLLPLYCGNHWCKDSLHILQDIDVDMYNSIPHIDGMTACRDALLLHSDFSSSQIEDISLLIQLVLETTAFTSRTPTH